METQIPFGNDKGWMETQPFGNDNKSNDNKSRFGG